MKPFIAFIVCLAFASFAMAQSAADKAEKRLAELLAPAGGSASPMATKPTTWKSSKAVESIELPIKPYAGEPVPLAAPPRKAGRPSSPPEGDPLVSPRDKTASKRIALPMQPLVRLPSRDAHAPLALPILARPAQDRASLTEPAFDASVDAAMKRFAPVRDQPVPFAPLNLPDPFEFMRYGELRHPPSEDATPPVMPLTKPK